MSSESTPLKSKEEILKNFQEEKSKNDILLKELKYPDAINGYSELIKNINKEIKENKELSKEEKDSIIKEFLLTSYSNLCFINIKQQDWDSTIKHASLILRFDINFTICEWFCTRSNAAPVLCFYFLFSCSLVSLYSSALQMEAATLLPPLRPTATI